MLKEITDILDLKDINNDLIDTNYIENEFINNSFFKVLVYLINNTVVGYTYYYDIYDRIEIEMIYVRKDYRKRNSASSMLEEIINKNKEITLEVDEKNLPAINLYKKFGFNKYAIRQNYYSNGNDALLLGINKEE